MRRLLLGYTRAVDRMTEALGWLSMMFVLATLAVGFYNVIARFLGRTIGVQLSSNTYIELQWYLYSLVFLLGFPYILKNGINVRVDFIYGRWPQRRQATLNFWGHLFFLVPFCLIGIWVSINPVFTAWGRLPDGSWGPWEVSPDPGGLPRAPIKTMIPMAFVFLLLQAIAELIKLYPVMRGRAAALSAAAITDDQASMRVE